MKIASEIDLADVAFLFNHNDRKKFRATIRWCETHGVEVHKAGKRKFVLDNEFSPAYESFHKNPVTISKKLVPVEPESLTNQTSEEMEKIELKPSQQMKGLFLTCKCRTKPLYKHEGEVKCKCKFFQYKVRIGIPKTFRIPGGPKEHKPILNATNYEDAVIELINIRKQLEKNSFKKGVSEISVNQNMNSIPFSVLEKPAELYEGFQHISLTNQERGPLLLDAVEKYLKKLEKKGHTKENNAEAKRFLYGFIHLLEKTSCPITVRQMYFSEINFDMAESFSDWLKKENTWWYNGKITAKSAYMGKTFDKAIGRLSSFMNYIILTSNIKVPNYFDEKMIERSPKSYGEPVAFPIDEFSALLEVVTPENGWGEWCEKKRYMYYDWLKDAFIFGLVTGGRRDAVAFTKWKNIEWSGNIPTRIKIEKYKLNRQHKIVNERDKAFWSIDIDEDLERYLIDNGLYRNRGKDEYIIAPRAKSRSVVKNALTKGFPHYYKLLNTGKHFTFNKLRKTRFTYEAFKSFTENRKMNVEHENLTTTHKYYIDPSMLSQLKRQKTEVKLFG